jgi:hypothetical protein
MCICEVHGLLQHGAVAFARCTGIAFTFYACACCCPVCQSQMLLSNKCLCPWLVHAHHKCTAFSRAFSECSTYFAANPKLCLSSFGYEWLGLTQWMHIFVWPCEFAWIVLVPQAIATSDIFKSNQLHFGGLNAKYKKCNIFCRSCTLLSSSAMYFAFSCAIGRIVIGDAPHVFLM